MGAGLEEPGLDGRRVRGLVTWWVVFLLKGSSAGFRMEREFDRFVGQFSWHASKKIPRNAVGFLPVLFSLLCALEGGAGSCPSGLGSRLLLVFFPDTVIATEPSVQNPSKAMWRRHCRALIEFGTFQGSHLGIRRWPC